MQKKEIMLLFVCASSTPEDFPSFLAAAIVAAAAPGPQALCFSMAFFSIDFVSSFKARSIKSVSLILVAHSIASEPFPIGVKP